MNKAYTRINWENEPSDATPLNETNLNRMDAAINEIDTRVVTMDTTKLSVTTANSMVKDVAFNETTGVFTITKLNGSVVTINTALEKIATNFVYDKTTQKLILTLIDGTTQEVDLTALLTQYEFLDSDTIAFTISSDGKVTASVKNGSITGDMLEPNYLADVTIQANNAKDSADNAKESELLAFQYAEEAKESASQAQVSNAANITYDNSISGLSATNVKDALDEVAQGSVSAIATDTTITDSTNAPLIYGKFKGYTIQDGEPTPDAPVEIVGMDKVSVKTCGKNLINDAVLIGKNGIIDTYHEVKLKPNTTYYFVAKTTSGNGIARGYFGTYLLDKNNTKIFEYINQTDKYISEFTLTEEQANSIVKCRITANGSQPADMVITEVALSETPTYEPYKETVAEFDLTEPLYEGDYIEYRADGTGVLHRKMAKVVLTSNSINVQTSTSFNYFIVTPSKKKQTDGNLSACNKSKLINPKEQSKDIGTYYENPANFVFVASKDETVEEIKAKYNGAILLYELATPQEIELTAEQLAQFKQLRTFEPITNVLCEGETEIQYYKNTPSGVAVGTVHKMANDDKATYDGDGNVITETYAKQTDLEKVIDGTTTVAKATSATTATKATQDGSGNNIVNTYAKKTSVLSTVAQCTASTNITDIAGASALAELNDSLSTKVLLNKGNNGVDAVYEGITCIELPYSPDWKYDEIEPAWYYVIAINLGGPHTMQYWLGFTSTRVYSRYTNDSGATWTFTTLH